MQMATGMRSLQSRKLDSTKKRRPKREGRGGGCRWMGEGKRVSSDGATTIALLVATRTPGMNSVAAK